MKKTFWLITISLLSSLISAPSNAISQTGTANARVVTPLAIAATTPLEFGSFASSASAGTITQAGITTGGVTAISSGATRTAGVFTVTGENTVTTAYTFTLPTNATLNNGSNTMTANLSYASGGGSRTLTSGSDVVTVNGILDVAANQAAGLYSGTYSVTAVY